MLIADYWWIRRNSLRLAHLYKPNGIYRYARGWNWIAVVSLLVGIVFAIGGSYTAPGTPRASIPGPLDFLVPQDPYRLRRLQLDRGPVVSFFLYGILTKLIGGQQESPQPEATAPGVA